METTKSINHPPVDTETILRLHLLKSTPPKFLGLPSACRRRAQAPATSLATFQGKIYPDGKSIIMIRKSPLGRCFIPS
jgi:hypothetical protein